MKNQVLRTVRCNISGEAAGEIWSNHAREWAGPMFRKVQLKESCSCLSKCQFLDRPIISGYHCRLLLAYPEKRKVVSPFHEVAAAIHSVTDNGPKWREVMLSSCSKGAHEWACKNCTAGCISSRLAGYWEKFSISNNRTSDEPHWLR